MVSARSEQMKKTIEKRENPAFFWNALIWLLQLYWITTRHPSDLMLNLFYYLNFELLN